VLDDTQGRYDEAEPLYLEGLEKRRATQGNSHPDTLNRAESSLYLEKSLEMRRATLGNSHPDTLMRSINNLAVLYDDIQQGRYDEAEPLYLEVLEKRRATLGKNNFLGWLN